MTIRVLLCDDHPVYRRGLRALLDELDDIEVVDEAADGEAALIKVEESPPDVAIMDLHLPGLSGVEITRRIVAAHPEVRVLVLTMFEDDRYLLAALRAGAHGYLVKGADHDEIVRGLRAVASGQLLLGTGVSARLAGMIGAGEAADAFPQLSSREFEILQLIASGLSNQQIAQRLFLSPKTVRNNVSSILAKLGLESRAEAATRARDAGVGVDRPHLHGLSGGE
jgi:DNA-binding NarL/FixJ family response regulator